VFRRYYGKKQNGAGGGTPVLDFGARNPVSGLWVYAFSALDRRIDR
jgi:hypothetical protein